MAGTHHQVPPDRDADCKPQDPTVDSAETQYTGQLRVLDLHEEILRLIFKYVKGEPIHQEKGHLSLPRYSDKGVDSIKQVRLVCRDFCDLSSHLLIHDVSVSMRMPSLVHLYQVSRHPTISKGVRALRVNLSFFTTDLSENFNRFVEFQQRRLRRLIKTLLSETLIGPQGWDMVIKRCNQIWLSWDKLRSASGESSLGDKDREYIDILRQAHALYGQTCLEQYWMQADGSFLRTIAGAVSRMPAIKSLYIVDTESGRGGRPSKTSFPFNMEKPAVITAMAQPMSWKRAWNITPFSGIPIKFLSQIPLAIHRTGATLTHVHYGVNLNKGFQNLLRGPQDRDALKNAMRHLKSFKFEAPSSPSISLHGEPDMLHTKRFLECFTDTDSLENMTIDIGIKYRRPGPNPSAGRLLLTRRWSRLKSVKFSGPLHANELESFYSNTRGPVEVQLRNVLLLSGSWYNVVELMRANTPPLNRETQSFIEKPTGGELATLTNTQGEFFRYHFGYASWSYIQSLTPVNPLTGWAE